jgi:hypothetical protein
MFAGALTRLLMLEVTAPPLPIPPERTTWTLLLGTHEELTGPRGDVPAPQPQHGADAGRLGGDGLLGPASPWTRVDPGDPEAALIVGGNAAAAGQARGGAGGAGAAAPVVAHGGVVGAVLKSVRAGRLSLQVRMVRAPPA